ncbi:hypothetical protein A3Q34_02455 [Colwellia sp. PAMC 20917]|uniref:chemotaxis protein CheB n=1 Tax=Colwellia sp. PAMC 20917 TaxID=1816218 RepID=UPI00087901A7|nr:chemotaxis protein CheB [Colwellia sp. PAMC 20917]AOW75816.1 hypothetical protein A3Q34_02455 [Colwellia sp. PAMC 20917]
MESDKQKATKSDEEISHARDKEKMLSLDEINGDNLSEIKIPNYVVGIGASAGGLEALESLFINMPFKTGMAFIVIQHLSPDYKSMMHELLARKTMIPIKVATDQIAIEADTIYLLPPKKEMIAANGKLYLTDRENTEVINLPINTFFRSMAETYQEKSIAIVLSGTGSDGTKGITKVHDSGGFVIAQQPESCKFDSMPQNAIKTNKVDSVLPPESMPDALMKYSLRTEKVAEQLALGHFDAEVSEFSEILILLNNRFDLDFSQYKPSTITRRLERRLTYQKTKTLKEYINILLSNHEELESLYYDLLIGVTEFFRDPEAFSSLKSRIPKLLAQFKDDPEIRIWVSACASGQEAYTMSMMMTTAMENDPNGNKPFKIFATDIHNKSIQFAATGIYSEENVERLDEEYKKRFFTLLPSGKYQVTSEIRKPVIFAQHNLLKDPPFTRTHLVSCRNLLIYFNNTGQQRVLSLLSFSLLNKGLLFMGSSEAIGSHSGDFEEVDPKNRLFRKTRTNQGNVPIPLTVRTQAPIRINRNGGELDNTQMSLKSKKALDVLLQKYVPTSVLIDEQGNILHTFGDAGKYLSLKFGAASLNITALVGEQAKIVLTQMIYRIGKSYKPVKAKEIKGFNGFDAVDIEMHVLSDSPADLNYIIISLSESHNSEHQDNSLNVMSSEHIELNEVTSAYTDLRVKELEEELIYAQETLQVTVEELESSNEELQASNEELMASNEELQSTNEELQSVNEELFSVNAEFQQKEIERDELESDERSTIESANLGILFLDHNLRIRKYSPLAAELFNLIENDFHKPFSGTSGRLVQEIREDVQAVFRERKIIEKEVVDDDGLVYLMRISSHKPISRKPNEDDIDLHGVIITFSNITKLRTSQTALEQTQNRFNNTLDAISDGYFEWNFDTDVTFFSEKVSQRLGYSDEHPDIAQLLGEHVADVKSIIKQVNANKVNIQEVLPFIKADGNEIWMVCKGEIAVDEKTKQTKLIGVLIDFTKQKEVEIQLQQQALALGRSNELLEKFAYIVSHDIKAPIRHIQNYLMFLQQALEKNDAEAMHKEIKGIKDSTLGLTELVDDIITYARVTSEKKRLSKVNMTAIIDSVLSTFEPTIKENNIQVEHDDFPEIKGDKSLLTHLMQNLIGNACKYIDKETPHIAITHAIDKTNYVITVADNGIGFDITQVDKIFEPFRRLVTKENFEGSGIGLSICKTVVEQHNGSIHAESELGKGSSFVISLPL